MDYQHFLNHLPAFYKHWGKDTVQPKSEQFQQVLSQIRGMTTANNMQLLNWAVACMEPGEIYCEVGTYRGSTLVGALLNHPDRMAYAVDNFSEFDEDGSTLAALMTNLEWFGLTEQVYFCDQDFQQFFLELKELNTDDKIGVYFYDGAHDYRSTLMGLLLAKPFLADDALIILDDANWGTVQQAYWDFLALSPEAEVILELRTPVARYPTFWNGIQVLSWQRSRGKNYAPAIFSEHQHAAVIKSIYNLQLLEQRMESIELLYQEAVYLHEHEQFSEAEKKYRDYLLWREDDAKGWLNLGLLYAETENYQESSQALLKAINLDPSNSSTYYFLGSCYVKLDQPDVAIAAYYRAIEHDPDLIDAYNNLGELLHKQGETEQAEVILREAIAKRPNQFMAYLYLGNLLLDLGEVEDAIEIYQQACDLAPDNLDCANSLAFAQEFARNPTHYYQELGQTLYRQRNFSAAARHYQKLLNYQTVSPNLYLELADCFWQLHQQREAIETLQAGVSEYPASEALNYELILTLVRTGKTPEALATAELALEALPDSYTLKLLKSMILPLVYDSVKEIEFYRDRYLRELQALIRATAVETTEQQQAALAGLSRYASFYITYQARDMVEPQRLYAQLVQKVMTAAYPQWAQPLPMPPVEKRIRIGFVTHYLHSYSGTLWLIGWLKYATRKEFKIYSYYIGNRPDTLTQEFRRYSHTFRHIPGDLAAIAQQVRDDDLHLLIFPEIGMDPQTIQLAALRLAPVQCTAWGHPVTSGLSTIDYYLSSKFMEPDNAETHYTETLIRLPKLGIAYPLPALPILSKKRPTFGLREDAIVYLCCQAPFKYLPQHDYLLVEIARQVPQAQFVFIRADVLQSRLQRAFAAAGLNLDDYAVFLPAQPRNDYLMLNMLSDVYLDTLGFTGGNTTLDAIACGLPVVTCPGEFMRGRMSTGILQAVGVTETIARTEAEYIELAVKLGQDSDWCRHIAQKMLANRDQVFDDTTCIPALEAFYKTTVEARLAEQKNH